MNYSKENTGFRGTGSVTDDKSIAAGGLALRS